MGFWRIAGGIAAAVVAVRAAKEVIETNDPGVFVVGTGLTALSGATAVTLAKKEIDEHQTACLSYDERARIERN
jgi:hypothetical protein